MRVIGDDDVDDENNLVTLVHIWAGGSDKFPEASSQLARTLIRKSDLSLHLLNSFLFL